MSFKPYTAMTFDELLDAVRAMPKLKHLYMKSSSIGFREVFGNDHNFIGWRLVHPSKNLEKQPRQLFAMTGSFHEIDTTYLMLTPAQFFQLREVVAMQAEHFEEEDE